jgi:D-tyrosyl-tRNA(Tyr) deacylase
VSAARVTVGERTAGSIHRGLLALVGIATCDTTAEADWVIDKLLDLRIFENEVGKFDRSLRDIRGELLLVSQFTLLANTRQGRRPSFTDAARPEQALPLYEHMIQRARAQGVTVASGEFGAHMQVELLNDGPVTIVLDTADR